MKQHRTSSRATNHRLAGRRLARALATSCLVFGLISAGAPKADAKDKMANGRNIAAEVGFETSYSTLVKDTALGDEYSQSASHMALSWVPVFWFFQLGPVLTSSVSDFSYPKDNLQRKDSETRRGAGLRGKINFGDLQTDQLVPWVGATMTYIRTEARTTVTDAVTKNFAEYRATYNTEEISSEAGLTIFVNSHIGINISVGKTLASKQEVVSNPVQGSNLDQAPPTKRQTNQVRLGISTFF